MYTLINTNSKMSRFPWFWNGVGPNFVTGILLSLVNILNYVDRYTPSSLITDLKSSFGFQEQWKAGFLQTTQFLALTIIPPVIGVMGDRVSRKILVIVSLVCWTTSVLMSSFATSYWSFLGFQTMVGFGEAGYSTIAPTIFFDLFHGKSLTLWLAVFYSAIPIGNGLGYIGASSIRKAAIQTLDADNAWRWAIRFTCFPAGSLAIILIYCMKDPQRGTTIKDLTKATGRRKIMKNVGKSFIADLKTIFSIKTYVFALFGMTCMYFMTGALAWWGPAFMKEGCDHIKMTANDSFEEWICGTCDNTSKEFYGNVDLYFGGIMLIAGILGTNIGTLLSAFLRPKYPCIDPLIIGGGLFVAGFLLFAAFKVAATSITSAMIFTFVGTTFGCLNWAVVVDMSLFVVPASIRSTATGLQTAIVHGFGDAGSPYVVGFIADYIRKSYNTGIVPTANTNTSNPYINAENVTAIHIDKNDLTCSPDASDAAADFLSLQGALWITVVMTFLSSLIFMVITKFVVADRKKASGNENVEDTSSGLVTTI